MFKSTVLATVASALALTAAFSNAALADAEAIRDAYPGVYTTGTYTPSPYNPAPTQFPVP